MGMQMDVGAGMGGVGWDGDGDRDGAGECTGRGKEARSIRGAVSVQAEVRICGGSVWVQRGRLRDGTPHVVQLMTHLKVLSLAARPLAFHP